VSGDRYLTGPGVKEVHPMLEIVPASGFFVRPLFTRRSYMSKRHRKKSVRGSRKTSREEFDAPSIALRRQRLAKLLGRLLARHWLQEKKSVTNQE
jgi:hypothetical protein